MNMIENICYIFYIFWYDNKVLDIFKNMQI